MRTHSRSALSLTPQRRFAFFSHCSNFGSSFKVNSSSSGLIDLSSWQEGKDGGWRCAQLLKVTIHSPILVFAMDLCRWQAFCVLTNFSIFVHREYFEFLHKIVLLWSEIKRESIAPFWKSMFINRLQNVRWLKSAPQFYVCSGEPSQPILNLCHSPPPPSADTAKLLPRGKIIKAPRNQTWMLKQDSVSDFKCIKRLVVFSQALPPGHC